MKDLCSIIESDETRFDGILRSAAGEICDSGVKTVFISGGSCTGKTTTTKKLCGFIRDHGKTCHSISLDDFYRNLEESVYLPDGTRDVETINSLRIDLITQALLAVLDNEPVLLPSFDFKLKRRVEGYRTISPAEGDITVVEGLHALNPAIVSELHLSAGAYRIFLYTDSGEGVDSRFIRRLVRDSKYRATSAENIYSMWEYVIKNEKDSIIPFSATADLRINTFFSYESGILYPKAVKLLEGIGKDSKRYCDSRALIAAISGAESIPESLIPDNSLLHEFL